MNSLFILDDHGNPVPEPDVLAWGRWFENNLNRKVARTEVNGVTVSTVFLALDHQYGDGPPLLWETLVFGGPLNEEMERYSSLEDARRGHNAMVAKVEQAA